MYLESHLINNKHQSTCNLKHLEHEKNWKIFKYRLPYCYVEILYFIHFFYIVRCPGCFVGNETQINKKNAGKGSPFCIF